MQTADISLIGWLHSIACVAALLTGGYVLVARKGTRRHRKFGYWYIASMIALNVTVLAIYRFDILPRTNRAGANIFGIFHWFAVGTVAVIVFAFFAATRQRNSKFWAHVHAQCMLGSYYGLIGGLINEAFVRVDVLRRYAQTHGPEAPNVAATQAVAMTQTAAMLIYLGFIVYFALKVRRDRRWRISSGFTPASRSERNVTA